VTRSTNWIERYAPLVKRIAYTCWRACRPVQVEGPDPGRMIGLLEVANKYDASKGASFEIRRHPHPRRHARRSAQGGLGTTFGAPQHAHGQ
jgi:hypothetical protein